MFFYSLVILLFDVRNKTTLGDQLTLKDILSREGYQTFNSPEIFIYSLIQSWPRSVDSGRGLAR